MNLIIRVNASTKIGTGHLMRCLALARARQELGGEVIFILNTEALTLEERLQSQSMKVVYLSVSSGSAEDAKETANLGHQFTADWVVIDSYDFGGEYQKIIKNEGLRLLTIDDYGHAKHYYADIVLNQNISADEGLYVNRESYTQLLLGTKYTLLRREFWQWCGWKREISTVARKVLVTLGGSDPDNVTLKVIQALQLVEVDDLEVVVVVGGTNPHHEQLKSVCLDSKFPIQLKRNVTNMPELMAWADVAIAAGGSTNWELAFMGLPSVIIVTAENQRAIAEKLDVMKLAVNLGWYENILTTDIASVIGELIVSDTTRKEMTKSCQDLVDAEGSQRVLRNMEAKLLKLRLVEEKDSRLLWEWSNDPEVRAASFSTEPIAWEDHIQWFKSKINAHNCIFYIALDINNVPIGQIRYDIERNEAVISISIDRKFRYQGYGTHLINLGCKQIFRDTNLTKIHAYIKPNNQVSIKAFSQSNFQMMGATMMAGYEAVHLVQER
jgi:UDP-2,4-diacetamido-2,4,6-trideoxy-beta-L-altropyranose hydrolase